MTMINNPSTWLPFVIPPDVLPLPIGTHIKYGRRDSLPDRWAEGQIVGHAHHLQSDTDKPIWTYVVRMERKLMGDGNLNITSMVLNPTHIRQVYKVDRGWVRYGES